MKQLRRLTLSLLAVAAVASAIGCGTTAAPTTGNSTASTMEALAAKPFTANGEVRKYESVDALVTQATGSPLPVAALFDWLAGRNVPVPGWQADLSLLGEGRLRAQRISPPPVADLRVVLDR